MHPFSQQDHIQYLVTFALCAGAIVDLALAVFTEKLAVDRALRYAAAAVMATFAMVIGIGHLNVLGIAAFVLCLTCLQIPLFIRTRRALREADSGGSAA